MSNGDLGWKGREKWSLPERVGSLVAAGKRLCHPAHHDGGGEAGEAAYDMDDARVALSLAATLLAKAMHGRGQ